MLEMRPNCECCGRDLPPDSKEAMICAFECTFCRDCVERRFDGACPNCGGDFAARPTRAARLLARYPSSTKRVYNTECAEVHGDRPRAGDPV